MGIRSALGDVTEARYWGRAGPDEGRLAWYIRRAQRQTLSHRNYPARLLMKTSAPAARPTLLIACALLAATLLGGCHATTDARWTTADDTVYRWEHALPALPVEVRGQLPNVTQEQIAQAFPHALPVREPVGHPAARLVVDAGSDAPPADDSYCATPAPRESNTVSGTPFALTMTICDGTRLVASSRSLVDPGRNTVEDLPRQIDRLKNLMLIGIDGSPSQLVHIQS